MSLSPDLKTFERLAAESPGKLIPVTRRFLADGLTPLAAFRRMPASPYAFLLESVERGERIGRYSFVGSAPDLIFRGEALPKPHYTIETADGRRTEHSGDPLVALEQFLQKHKAIANSGTPIPPFCGGAVGYLGYDVVRLIEPRLAAHPPAKEGIEDIPDLLVPVYRTVLAFDHVLNTATVVHYADPSHGGARAAHQNAEKAIEVVVSSLRAPSREPFDEIVVPSNDAAAPAVKSNMEPDTYMKSVEKAKEYIAAGDITQVVPSQRFSRPTKASPFEVYRSLRAINPSPYMFYLHFGPLHLVGSSPEVLVRVQNGSIVVRPIAGTRRRGATAEEDANLAKELLADPKELAEHTMLLDLGRNDVGRVSEFGSVKVTEQMIIENYSHVMHIVSNVCGQMHKESNVFEVLRSCIPAGTLSGSPKIRAMEIIDEIEPDRRGPYGGAVGVMDFHGNLNTAIVIRTFIMQDRGNGTFDAHVQAGAGVVADSVPKVEYEETVTKAKALLRALSMAEARLDASK